MGSSPDPASIRIDFAFALNSKHEATFRFLWRKAIDYMESGRILGIAVKTFGCGRQIPAESVGLGTAVTYTHELSMLRYIRMPPEAGDSESAKPNSDQRGVF